MNGPRQRDHRDFTVEAYQDHAVGLRGFIATIIIDHRLAEDVVHEAFLELWLHPERWDPARGDLLSWLRTIAHRRAIDRIRSVEASRQRDLRIGTRDHYSTDHGVDQWDALFARARLRAALTTLTEKQRDAVILRYLGERTVPEVAQELGISVGTAKTRVRDGLLVLHRALAPGPAATAEPTHLG